MAAVETEERVKAGANLPSQSEVERFDASFADEVRAMPAGDDIDKCIQCGTCTGSCPSAKVMDYPPREIIAMIRAGMREKALSSNSMWECMSCYLCTVRCPRGVHITDLMYTLKNIASAHKMTRQGNRPHTMAKTFVGILHQLGRVHEATMLGWYYMQVPNINPLTAIPLAPVGLALLTHGRLPLIPKGIKNKAQLQAIIRKAEELGGKKG
jgi:quinone-modifying oxidoreductase, subunit QmoC